MSRKNERHSREIDIINRSPITLTPTDLSRLVNVSKPTACEDVRFLLSNNLVSKNKVRFINKNILRDILGIK